MNQELSSFAARLRGQISESRFSVPDFPRLALELFALQFQHNAAYQQISLARKLTPQWIEHWTQIPSIPTGAFKELELTALAPDARTAVFHSSGTTEQKPSRHFHCAESLTLYEASLWAGFETSVLRSADSLSASSTATCGQTVRAPIFLTPSPADAPRSSLVHMFEIVRQKLSAPESVFTGGISADGSWRLDFEATLAALCRDAAAPRLILGTAFSFVHLVDLLAEKNLRLTLPPGSCVMETGGYKNRSRTMPKAELHALIQKFLGVPCANIICEYGMSELSSQAYANSRGAFRFPPWARVRIISPETGREVADGETGLIHILDLANVFSVAAIQTEDLGIRCGDGFELIGRAQLAEPRGCSLMTA